MLPSRYAGCPTQVDNIYGGGTKTPGSYAEQQLSHINRSLQQFEKLNAILLERVAMVYSDREIPDAAYDAAYGNNKQAPEPSPVTPLDERLHDVRMSLDVYLTRFARTIENIRI